MLKVNEIFGPTLQGEGPSQGRKVMFLRLSLCNLSCSWCDSKYTWDWKNFDKTKEVHEKTVKEIVEELTLLSKGVRSLVVSGGEPLIQQKKLIPLFQRLKDEFWWIEIETNGTLVPEPEVFRLLDQINCSPKLSNSGDSRDRRVKDASLRALVAHPKTFFKFVIGSQEDVGELWEYVSNYSIDPSRVYLMPLGKTPEELQLTTALVKKMAEDNGFIYSSRLHIELWGMKRGV